LHERHFLCFEDVILPLLLHIEQKSLETLRSPFFCVLGTGEA
jgi:hypothetical protein